MAIAPGEATTIALNFTMPPGMGGPHRFDVRVHTDDPLQPEKVLIVKSNWQ
jgi:hypothetical protein